jgi:hypothetical protein
VPVSLVILEFEVRLRLMVSTLPAAAAQLFRSYYHFLYDFDGTHHKFCLYYHDNRGSMTFQACSTSSSASTDFGFTSMPLGSNERMSLTL